MNIVILGPQGSGKGTQAKLLAEKLGLFHMESGKMLREIAETDKRIKGMLNIGELVPDNETIDYMENYLLKNNANFNNLIFDGFPRTLNQYSLLKQWLSKHDSRIDRVVYLEVGEEVSVKRLSARRICDKCGRVYNLITNPPVKEKECDCGGKLVQRDDDKPKAIRNRLEIFKKDTIPVSDMAEAEDKLIKVDGERPIKVIFEDILKRLKI